VNRITAIALGPIRLFMSNDVDRSDITTRAFSASNRIAHLLSQNLGHKHTSFKHPCATCMMHDHATLLDCLLAACGSINDHPTNPALCE
jgi:hypothetical protein